jgi:hypothetical protein
MVRPPPAVLLRKIEAAGEVLEEKRALQVFVSRHNVVFAEEVKSTLTTRTLRPCVSF